MCVCVCVCVDGRGYMCVDLSLSCTHFLHTEVREGKAMVNSVSAGEDHRACSLTSPRTQSLVDIFLCASSLLTANAPLALETYTETHYAPMHTETHYAPMHTQTHYAPMHTQTHYAPMHTQTRTFSSGLLADKGCRTGSRLLPESCF